MIDPHRPIANCSTHDLFNELQRRLEVSEGELATLADKVDVLHHDYTDIIQGRCVACGNVTSHTPGGIDCPPN
jgi:hypothetical protein